MGSLRRCGARHGVWLRRGGLWLWLGSVHRSVPALLSVTTTLAPPVIPALITPVAATTIAATVLASTTINTALVTSTVTAGLAVPSLPATGNAAAFLAPRNSHASHPTRNLTTVTTVPAAPSRTATGNATAYAATSSAASISYFALLPLAAESASAGPAALHAAALIPAARRRRVGARIRCDARDEPRELRG